MPSTEPNALYRYGPQTNHIRALITPILQVRRLRFRFMKLCVRSHEVNKWQNRSISRHADYQSVLGIEVKSASAKETQGVWLEPGIGK